MDYKKKKLGFTLAAAAALAFVSAPLTAFAQTDDQIICYGSNACRGRSACVTAVSSCKGNNLCRGQGMTLQTSQEDCLNAGGTTTTYN